MSLSISRALIRAVAFVTALALLAAAPAAIARPPVRPGAPTDLVVVVSAASGGGYQLDSTWKSGAHTTSFKVKVTNAAGTVLASDSLSGTTWSAKVKAPATSVLTVTITPYNGTRRGPGVSKNITLPDVTGPTGSFTADDAAFVGSIHQSALADDVSAASAITRTVDWGDASPLVPWTSGADITHSYAAQGRYVSVLTLADEAGNQTRLELPIVIDDHAAPSGAYSLAPTTGWASWTAVTLTEDSLTDDFSPSATIKRVVSWGDGSESTWSGTAPSKHIYNVVGTFTPQVTVTDEAGNSATIASGGSTTITADVAGPMLRLTLPRKSKRASVASWKLLKGTATDAATGVAKVSVLAVQKRATGVYAYRPATKRWIRVGTTLAVGFRKARPITATRDAAGHWSAPLARLSLGKLVYRVSAVDRVGNAAKVVRHAQVLTRR